MQLVLSVLMRYPVFPTGCLLCTKCWGRTSSPRWRMQTVRTERTHPRQPDTPSCPCTTAGCSTPAATSSMRTADVCLPYPGDHSQPWESTMMHVMSCHKHSSCLAWKHKWVPTFHFLHFVYKLYALAFFFCCCLYWRHHFLLASHTHFPLSHAWSCSCVSRAMFPETEQQAVSQMMATESNYSPAVLSAWWWGFVFFGSLFHLSHTC